MPATPAEYRRELARLLNTLDDQIATYGDSMEAILDDARRQIIGDLANLDLDSPSRPMLNRALSGVDDALANMRSRLAGEMAAGTAATFETGAAIATAPLGAEFAIAGAAISSDTLAIASQFSADLIQDISAQARRRINAELTSVMVGAKTPHEAAKAIGRNLTDPNHFRTIAHRSRAIVVTELGRAQALGTQAAQQQLEETQAGIGGPPPRKRWLNAHLPGARATHLTAESRYAPGGDPGPIPIREEFTINGHKALYPRDPSLPASESVHCHCVSVTVFLDEPAGGEAPQQQLPDLPARPPRVGSNPDEILNRIDALDIQAPDDLTDGDGWLNAIYRRQGFDAPTTHVDAATWDAVPGDHHWRGVTERRFADQITDGDHFPGYGIYGNGTYTAFGEGGEATARRFAAMSARRGDAPTTGGLIEFKRHPRARIVNVADINQTRDNLMDTLGDRYDARIAALRQRNLDGDLSDDALRAAREQEGQELWRLQQHVGDPGRLAALMGYDAIEVLGNDYLVVLNRAIMVTKDGSVMDA